MGYPELTEEDEDLFESWFADLAVQEVSEVILRRAAALRRERRMKLGDSIIGATALVIGANLVTRNEGDFKHIPGLQIINPFAAPEAA